MTFMIEAKAEALLAMEGEAFELAIYTVEPAVLRRVGMVRTMGIAPTYAEARAAAVIRFRERGAIEGFELGGIYGGREIRLTGGESLFVIIGEL